MKKSVGIFTYMQTNYGAVLQAYALQTFLRQKGADAEIVDFTTTEHLKAYRIFRPINTSLLKRWAIYLLVAIRYFPLRRRIKRTVNFKQQHFHYTRRYPTVEDVLANPPQEDIYISGSDQVFNLSSPYYKVYYLNFDKGAAKKVAYAASFGHTDFSDVLGKKISPYLNDFDYLSCRENAGAKFLHELTGKQVPCVVDPVLLLSVEQWHKVAVYPKMRDYIFVYDLNGGQHLMEIAARIKTLTGKSIICLTCGALNHYQSADKVIVDAGPGEFVGWIANASFVVTDSFHGTAFSLIFLKPFLNYVAIEKASDRITTLLHRAGLVDRMIRKEEITSYDYEMHLNSIDVEREKWVKESEEYIDSFLRQTVFINE